MTEKIKAVLDRVFKKKIFVAVAAAALVSICANAVMAVLLVIPDQTPILPDLPETQNTSEADAMDGFTLIASIEEQGIYLYSASQRGVLLIQGGGMSCYDWMSPADNIKPRLYYADFNRDGQEETAVVLDTKSDSGNAQDTVHFPTSSGETELTPAQVTDQFANQISVSQTDDQSNVIVAFDDQQYQFYTPRSETGEPLTFKGVYVGTTVSYSVDDAVMTVTASVDAAYSEDDVLRPVGNIFANIMCLNGEVVYDNTQFVFTADNSDESEHTA